MINKKTAANVSEACRLRARGVTHRELAEKFGVSQTAIRQWTDPAYYLGHKESAVEWRRDHAPALNRRYRGRHQKLSREEKDAYNARQRQKYAADPAIRERLTSLVRHHWRSAQARVGVALRQAVLGHGDRIAPVFTRFMEAATGLSRDEFTTRFMGEGDLECVAPLVAFDLTNPDHVVRACWVDNLQLISRLENQRKGKRIPDGLDVMALPWCGNPEALIQAQHLIARALSAVNRSGISNGD